MQPIKEAAAEFLAHRRSGHGRVANAEDAREQQRTGGCASVATTSSPSIRTQTRSRGIVPTRIWKSIPGGVEAVVIGTRPELAEHTMHECAELGIKHVWMHRGLGAGSVSATATDYGREHGITVIDGGCPSMFGPTADFGYKVMRFVYAGKVPGRFEPGEGKTMSANKELLIKRVERYNAGDLDGVLELYADDCARNARRRFRGPRGDPRASGK